jgi:hypothetical protein
VFDDSSDVQVNRAWEKIRISLISNRSDTSFVLNPSRISKEARNCFSSVSTNMKNQTRRQNPEGQRKFRRPRTMKSVDENL